MDGRDARFHHERGWADEQTRVASRIERLGIQETSRAEAGGHLEVVDGAVVDGAVFG